MFGEREHLQAEGGGVVGLAVYFQKGKTQITGDLEGKREMLLMLCGILSWSWFIHLVAPCADAGIA